MAEFEWHEPMIDASPFSAKWGLSGLTKGRIGGKPTKPLQLGPKPGDRIFIDRGDGTMIERIAEAATSDRREVLDEWGQPTTQFGVSFTSRPVTAADGPRSREQRRMVRAMRKSRRRRKMRAWAGRVLGTDARDE